MTSLAELAAQLSPKARELLARELIRTGTVFAADSAVAEPVAVVGLGCRLPGNVAGPQAFWSLLVNAEDAITQVPADRWDADAFYDPDPLTPGTMTTKWGGFLSDAAGFDADFFGITPREAAAMDPQHRILLEVSCEALENAGVPTDALSGTRTGVIVGLSSWDYSMVSFERRAEVDAYLSTGNVHSAAVGRISYLLGLRGPAVAVDTACSSSLVAVHLACQSLRLRESDLVLAGGVHLSLSPMTSVALSKLSALSPTGRCKTFDAGADGFVRSEGCGVVVLKRLSDAVRDQDRVLAVVRGTAINQDGRSNGLTAPNALAQRDVISDALRAGDVAADTVNYVEAHGTGTVLGDPIEFESLAAIYGDGDAPCALGAVKTNLGHLEAAAGITGFIKAVLAVQHGRIPANLHFTQWNPAIDSTATRFFVPTSCTPWPERSGPRRAAVSSFGVSGTNAHVVVEQGPEPVAAAPAARPAVTTLVISGKTPQRIASTAAVLADWLDSAGAGVQLADVAHTLNRRARQPRFATVSARDRDEAVKGLHALAVGQSAAGVAGPHERPGGRGTVFVYSGQGSQWAGMGRQLLADEPAFAAAVARLEPDFVAEVGFSLHRVLAEGEEPVGIDRIQPVLVGVQLALTTLWRSYGVEPDAVIGHSMGEVTAAVVAGALTVAEGLRVIATRSRLMSRLSGRGAMALLELDSDATNDVIADYPQVTLAVYAAPRQSVIAGPPAQVDALVATVRQRNRLARRIDVDVASHHPTIDPVLPELRTALVGLSAKPPSIPIIITTYESTATTTAFDADYWAANLRNPVRFSQAIATAAKSHDTFIEISPHPLLTHAVTETLESVNPTGRVLVTSAMNRDDDQTLFFHSQLAAVGAMTAAAEGRLADIPSTPWHHCAFWVSDRSASWVTSGAHPLLGAHTELPSGQDHVWQADVGTDMCPWLADHRVHGQPVMPGTGFAEIVLAAGVEALGLAVHSLSVHQLEIEQMLPLDSHTRITTQLSRHSDNDIRVEVYSRSANGGWCRHAVARIETLPPGAPLDPAYRPGDGTPMSPADFYAALRRTGQHHGPAFAALTRIVSLPGGASTTEITVPDEAPRYPGCLVHPVMLDAALQSLVAAIPEGAAAEIGEAAYLPVSFEAIRVFGEVGRHARCHAELVGLDQGGAGKLGRITLTDDAGKPTAEITGIYARRVERRTMPLPVGQKIFETTWVDCPITAETATPEGQPGSWLVLSDDAVTKTDEFADSWRSSSRRVVTATLADESAVLAAFSETAADPQHPPVGVVIFLGHDSLHGTDPDAALKRARDSIWFVSAAVRAIVGGWHGRSPRVWLVTGHGLAVQDGESGEPAIGALRGLVRVLAYEHPDLRFTLVDLETGSDVVATMNLELASSDSDDVVAWRGGRRYAERLSRATLGARQRDPVVRQGGAYIITGGLGGLGMVVAGWLIKSGAGRVVLNGRSGPKDGQHELLAELRGRAEVVVVPGDIASPGVAEQLVAAAEAADHQLCGIVHAAAVLDDSLLMAMDSESLTRIWSPKAAGALRLHQATASRALDWWVVFSSMASLLGSPGQAAYACASAWVDAFVSWRTASGLPAAAINWGPWSEVGLARALTGTVLDPITPTEGVEALESVLAADRTRTGIARLRADRILAAFPEIRRLGYFAQLVEEFNLADDAGDWAGPDELRDLDPAEIRRVVADRLRLRVAAVMGHADQSGVDPAVPLVELGLDSLMAVRIRNIARGDFGVEPPVALLLEGASLRDISTNLLGQLGYAEDTHERPDRIRDRAHQRAVARQGAALRRKRGERV